MALSFAQAQALLLRESDQLRADAKAVESARLRREGMQGVDGPSVVLTGMTYHYSVNADISLDPAHQALGGALGQLPPALGGILGQLPQLPSNYNLHTEGNRGDAMLSLLWPLYTGGLGDALRSELDALSDEALAEASDSELGLHSLLVQRYFGLQLAEHAARLREDVLATVQAHDAAAEKMLAQGSISRLERLQAKAALAEASQQARKAREEAQLAATALARTLKADPALRPTTPLFLHSQPLPPLQDFIQAAWQNHPGLSKVQAKQRQATALHAGQEALRKPMLLGFGMADATNKARRPTWVAGLAVRWSLWDGLDRDRLSLATQRKIEQAELTERQAHSDIALLVEKNWLAVEHARTRYLAQQTQEDLARELLRLHAAGLREGTSTQLDWIDAQTQLAKVQTERAQSANQYVQALATLLQSTGQSRDFLRYVQQADIHVGPHSP